MANKRRLIPRSRSLNERIIQRLYQSSGKGMVTDTFRVPDKSLGELWNARDFGTEVRGRQGSYLHTTAKVGLLPSDIIGDIDDAFSTGALKDLNNGDIFQVYSWKDFSGGDLFKAKENFIGYNTPLIRAYDLFKVISKDTYAVEFIGNIAVPVKDYYYPSAENSMTAVKSGKEIALSGSPTLSGDLVGTYFNWGYLEGSVEFIGYRDLIVGVNGNVLTVKYDGGVSENTSIKYCFIQGSIYASYYHQEESTLVAQVDDRLYKTSAPLSGWTEIVGIHNSVLLQEIPDVVSENKPFPSEGVFHEVRDDLILSNSNGHYRIVLKGNVQYYYKINEENPNYKAVMEPVYIWGFQESRLDETVTPVGFNGIKINTGVSTPRAGNKYFNKGIII